MKLSAPHQGYGLDVWGPTIMSTEGYRYLLTMVDLFHGYVRYFPLRTKSTREIISVCLNYVWWHSGLPTFILTDDDAAFRADLCIEFCRLSNIETWRTAPYSPWELGRVERRHQDLNLAMKAMRDKEAWPHHLPGPVAHAFNTLVSTVTKVAPAEVEYGYLPRGPLELMSATEELEPAASERKVDVDKLDHHMQALRDSQRVFTRLALHHGERQRQRGVERKNAEAKAKVVDLKVGDRVSVERPRSVKGIPKKALIQWRGPYEIVQISRRGYVCRHTDGSTVTVNRAFLQPYTASGSEDQAAEVEAAQPGNVAEFKEGQLLAIGEHMELEEGNHRFWLARFVRG